MEETTHDSSSSSRKSEEKCPPAGGIKMKIGGFKTGHCYHKPSDAAIQQEPSGVNSGVWLPRLSQDDFDRVVQTTPSGLLAVSDAEVRPDTSKILRPQLDQCPDLTDIYLQADVQTDTHAVSEMRLLSVDKNAAMWNDCFKEHASSAWSSSKCTNQYKHGCEVQLNIPEKQLRLWTECKSSSGNRD